MVTKRINLHSNRKARLILAKNHMVTKLWRHWKRNTRSLILAKNHMVTKRLLPL